MARTKKTAGKNVAAEAQAAARKAVSEAQAVARKVAAVEKAAETSEKAEPGTEEKETKTAAKETKAAAKTVVEETKKAARKATTRRSKKDMKVNAYVEYYGKQVHENTMIADVKKAWKKSGHKIGEIKTMDLYIKPEESKVYYVINETESGSVEF